VPMAGMLKNAATAMAAAPRNGERGQAGKALAALL
jgi:hypothetical protein